MKIKNTLFPLVLAAAALALPARAQLATNGPAGSPPQNQTGFFNSVVGYFSAFNTNLDSTFGANRGTVWTGVDSVQGGTQTLANTIGLSYDLWRTSAGGSSTNGAGLGNIALSLETVCRNGGITGTVISTGAGAGLGFVVHDVRLTAYVDGAYYFPKGGSQACVEFGLRAFKALSGHTFAGVGIGFQEPGARQIFSAFLGFTF